MSLFDLKVSASGRGGFPINPVKINKDGPLYSRTELTEYSAKEILLNNYFKRTMKMQATDFSDAAASCNEAAKFFEKSFSDMREKQHAISDEAKKASGSVRKAANDLSDGLAKLEKTANFDRLERYVGLLERAAAAMQQMAELHKDGKLEKIANALK